MKEIIKEFNKKDKIAYASMAILLLISALLLTSITIDAIGIDFKSKKPDKEAFVEEPEIEEDEELEDEEEIEEEIIIDEDETPSETDPIPEEKPDEPEKNLVEPGDSSDEPEENPDKPEENPVEPGDSSDELEENPDEPEENPVQTENESTIYQDAANDDLVKVNIKLDGGTINSYAVYSSDMVGIYITKNDGSGISYLWRSGQLSYSQSSSPLSGADHARIQELVRSWIN